MKHQIFSTYYQLSLENKVEPWRCINPEHGSSMIPHWDDVDEVTQIKCILGDCDYKINPGLNFYNKLIEAINSIVPEKEMEDSE